MCSWIGHFFFLKEILSYLGFIFLGKSLVSRLFYRVIFVGDCRESKIVSIKDEKMTDSMSVSLWSLARNGNQINLILLVLDVNRGIERMIKLCSSACLLRKY